MRILFVLKSMAQKAGTERVMSDKINWLANHGHYVTLVTYEQGNHPISFTLHKSVNVVDLNTRFFELARLPIYHRIIEYYKMRKLFSKRLLEVINKYSPDVLVTTTYSMNVADLIANLNVPIKKIIESHSAWFSVGKKNDFRDNPTLHFLADILDVFYYRRVKNFNLLVALTTGDANDWKCYNGNVITIPNPLTFYPKSLSLRVSKKQILCVGRLNYQKGFDLLIASFAKIAYRFPEWHVDIYGDGEEKDKLQNLVRMHQLDNQIHFCAPTDRIYDKYQNSDFFVLSSRYEGFGLVLIEAMSCACPCVSFRCKYGPEDIIEDGMTGLLVKDGDIDELAAKMEWMITHNDDRIEMGKRARKAVWQYQIDNVMQKWERAYLSLL